MLYFIKIWEMWKTFTPLCFRNRASQWKIKLNRKIPSLECFLQYLGHSFKTNFLLKFSSKNVFEIGPKELKTHFHCSSFLHSNKSLWAFCSYDINKGNTIVGSCAFRVFTSLMKKYLNGTLFFFFPSVHFYPIRWE